ncbi:hypothetical protein [Microbacterium paraoxydans]|uniref:hypothetical protein n=1 Tax=Microbacterium paraoxydans TaxID=199592 RepID=UPI0004684332|nr:hypothetical protein [Microbacterium paraoxydans]
MGAKNPDEIREELRHIAEELARLEELREHRDQVIAQAREANLTQREVALLLQMTERGVSKALTSYRQRTGTALAS